MFAGRAITAAGGRRGPAEGRCGLRVSGLMHPATFGQEQVASGSRQGQLRHFDLVVSWRFMLGSTCFRGLRGFWRGNLCRGIASCRAM